MEQQTAEQSGADINIDSTKYEISCSKNIYDAFIETNNYKNSLTISATESTSFETPQIGKNDNSEEYTILLARRNIYDRNIRHGVKKLQFTLSNIKFSQDGYADRNGLPWDDQGQPNGNIIQDTLLGIPCFLSPMFCLANDPLNVLNSDITIRVGENAVAISTIIDQPSYDFSLRLHNSDALAQYDPLLRVDKYAEYSQANCKLPSMPKFYKKATGQQAGSNLFTFMQMSRFAGTYIDELRADRDNVFSQVYGRRAPYTCVFTKALPTPNYTYNKTTSLWVPTANTTALGTLLVAGEQIPCNVCDASGNIDYVGLSYLPTLSLGYFYYNDGDGGFEITAGNLTANPPVLPTYAPAEPAGQSLTQQITFENLETDLYNDFCTRFDQVGCFTNCGRISINKKYSAHPEAIFKVTIPQSPDVYAAQVVGNTWAYSYFNFADIQISMNVESPYVRMKQYVIPDTLKTASTSTVNMIKATQTVQPIVLTGSSWNASNVVSLQSNSVPLNNVPLATALFVSQYDNNNKAHRHGYSGCKRAEIINLALSIDSLTPTMGSFSKKEIFIMSKNNGLREYNFADISGAYKLVPNFEVTNKDSGNQTGLWQTLIDTGINPPTNAPAIRSFVVSQTHQGVRMSSQQILKKVDSHGSIPYLKWGQDISLRDPNVVANVSGLTSNLQWFIKAQSDDKNNNTCKLYIINLHEYELIIGADGNAQENKDLINKTNVMRAIELFQRRVSHGLMTHVSLARGGNGFFKHAVHKLSHFVPKLVPVVKRALHAYHTEAKPASKKLSDMLR